MTILELCFSEAWGGLEIYVSTFAKRFAKAGHDIICVSIPGSRLNNELLNGKFKNINIIPKLKYLDFLSALKIKKSINQGIDIIHVHQSKDLSTSILLKKLFTNSKLVFSQQMDSRYRKKDLFHRWIYKNLDCVVTMTDDMKKNHIDNTAVNPDKIKTIYNGIDVMRFNNTDSSGKYNLPSDKIIIGTVGRLDRLKNQELLIDAALCLIKSGITNLHFIIIGDETDSITGKGYRQKLFDKLEINNLKSFFTFFSFTNQVENLFRAMDIFVLPTDKESFGYVIIEAMASGLPVIASNKGGPKEIIEENINGFLFESGDFKDLATKLELLIDNHKKRIEMGNESIRIVNNKFDIDLTIKKYLELFNNLILE